MVGCKIQILLLLFLLTCTHGIHSQNWEYALSQRAFESALIRDLLIVDDKIFLAGHIGHCEYPAIWLFDTSGLYLDSKLLDINPYEVGYIENMKYDDTSGIITLLAYVQLGTDYGGASTYVWQLDTGLNIINSKDLFGEDVSAFDQAQFSNSFITVQEDKDFVIFDDSFNLIKRQRFPFFLSGAKLGLLVDSVFVFHEFDYRKESYLYILDWDGNVLTKDTSDEIINMFTLGQSVYTLDKNHILRIHTLPDLAIIDSLILPWTDESQLSKTSDSTFEFTRYPEEGPATIQIYGTDLRVIEEISNDLTFETLLTGRLHNNIYYQVGRTFGYFPDVRSNAIYFSSLIPFVRKRNLLDPVFLRDNISISHVSVINPADHISTDTTMDGLIFDYYSYENPPMLIYDITFKNTTSELVSNFSYFTDVGVDAYCSSYNNYKHVNEVHMLPGDELTLRDTLFPYIIYHDRGLLFYVAATNHMLSDSAFSKFRLGDLATSVQDDLNPFRLSLYPNPVHELLVLKGAEGFKIPPSSRVEILAMDGRRIGTTTLDKEGIDVSHLVPGMYIIRIRNTEKAFLGSFIKTD